MTSPGEEKIYAILRPMRGTTKKMLADGLRSGFKVEVKCPPDFYPEVNVETRFLPGALASEPIRTQFFTPKRDDGPPILYIHGGGWSMEQSDDYFMMLKKIAAMNGSRIAAINYRLAPENPFPAGLDDCAAAYLWLRENAGDWGGGKNLVVGGDSAGGNLCFALALRLKQEGAPMPSGLFGFCPLTDMIFEQYPSYIELANDNFIYDAAFAGFVRGGYANCNQWKQLLVSPMYGDLRGLPPTFLVAGAADPLCDDNRAFAERLKHAGVAAELHVYQGMPHAFYCFSGVIPEEQDALERLKTFLSPLPPGEGRERVAAQE